MSWNGLMRRDGVHVVPSDIQGEWVICAKNGGILAHDCPCCSLPMQSERAAKLVADGWFPPVPEAA